MKQLTFSFLCLLLGSVLVCTSFVMAAEPAAAEGIVQEETKGAQEAILAPLVTSKPSAPIPSPTGRNKAARRSLDDRHGDGLLSL